MHDVMPLGVDLGCVLEACGAGLVTWQNPFDDFQVTLPFYKIPLDLWTLPAIRKLWIDSSIEHRIQYEAALPGPHQDKGDQDDGDYDASVGWSHGTDTPKLVYSERLQLVRSVFYMDELPAQSFRITPVPLWSSKIDHPNPWSAIPYFLQDFPEEVERRRTLSPYWGGGLSVEKVPRWRILGGTQVY